MVHSGILRAFGPDLRRLLGRALSNRISAFAAGLGLTALHLLRHQPRAYRRHHRQESKRARHQENQTPLPVLTRGAEELATFHKRTMD
jgi:hypothetical protein